MAAETGGGGYDDRKLVAGHGAVQVGSCVRQEQVRRGWEEDGEERSDARLVGGTRPCCCADLWEAIRSMATGPFRPGKLRSVREGWGSQAPVDHGGWGGGFNDENDLGVYNVPVEYRKGRRKKDQQQRMVEEQVVDDSCAGDGDDVRGRCCCHGVREEGDGTSAIRGA
eukprot:748372-Hanusia_phi.AAC.3